GVVRVVVGGGGGRGGGGAGRRDEPRAPADAPRVGHRSRQDAVGYLGEHGCRDGELRHGGRAPLDQPRARRLRAGPRGLGALASQDDVRRIALSLPSVSESDRDFAFSVTWPNGKEKGFAWVWKERIDPKKARVPNHEVLAVRVSDLEEKELLLASDPEGEKFFTEPHYNGFPAVLVRLAGIDADELGELLVEAWYCMAPKPLRAEF